MTYVEKVPDTLQNHASTTVNDARTCAGRDTALTRQNPGSFSVPRTLSDLASFLHGYVIKAGGEGNEPRRFRASNLERLIDALSDSDGPEHAMAVVQMMRKQSTELAALDPSLSWLPEWKPRVAVSAGGER